MAFWYKGFMAKYTKWSPLECIEISQVNFCVIQSVCIGVNVIDNTLRPQTVDTHMYIYIRLGGALRLYLHPACTVKHTHTATHVHGTDWFEPTIRVFSFVL